MFSNLNYTYYKPSRLAIGCEPLGGVDWGNYDLDDVRKAVAAAIDNGITAFDTADVYGLGKSEEELSKALGKDRHKAFIISKFGIRWETNHISQRSYTYKDSSPRYIKYALENSLKRLRLETIPLYMVHWPDNKVPNAEVIECLENLRISGKILNYGLSNFDINSIETISKDWGISCIQDSFNLLEFQAKVPIFKRARELQLSTFSYGTLAQGILSNKYSSSSIFPSNDRRNRLINFKKLNWLENEKIINKLEIISKVYKKTISSTAIRWVLDSGYIDCAIVGVKTIKQLKENVSSLNWELKSGDIRFLSGD